MQLVSPINQTSATSHLNYASPLQRILAFGLDYLVIAAYMLVLAVAALLLNRLVPGLWQTLFSTRDSAHLTAFLVLTLPVCLYFAVLQSSHWQATWGKYVLGLKLVRADGAPVSFARALARTDLQFIPWELSHTLIWQLRFDPNTTDVWIFGGFTLVWVLIGANLISMVATRTHQTIYDLIVKTLVIKRD